MNKMTIASTIAAVFAALVVRARSKKSLSRRRWLSSFRDPEWHHRKVQKWTMALTNGDRRTFRNQDVFRRMSNKISLVVLFFCVAQLTHAQNATGVDLRTVKSRLISTGAGASDVATLRVISASDSPAGSVTVSSAAIYNVSGSTLAIHCTDAAGAIISCGSSSSSSVTVSTGSITSFQGGSWSVSIPTATIVAPNGNTTPIPVSGTFFQAVQPVSLNSLPGAIATTSTSTIITAAIPAGTNNVGTVSGSSITAFQGGIWNVGIQTVTVVSPNGNTTPLPVTGPLTDTQLRATPVPISGANFGSYTVTPGTGTFPVSGTFFQAIQPISITSANGALAVTSTNTIVTNSGTFPVQATISGGALGTTSSSTFITGQSGALAVTSTSTIVTNAGVFQVQASIPGGALAVTSTATVVTNAGTFAVQAAQNGSFTVTPGTGNWSINGSTSAVTILAGNAEIGNVKNSGTFAVQATIPGGSLGTTSTSTVISGQTGALNVVSSNTVVTNAGIFAVQSAQNGSYTVTPGTGTFPVSGPLTDTQLRATPVPVSGSFSASGSSVTIFAPNGNTTPIPVQASIPGGSIATTSTATVISGQTGALAVTSTNTIVTNAGVFAVQAAQAGSYTVTPGTGTFPVSGPLTDTQLRASPVPVSGTFFQSVQPVNVASANGALAVTSTSTVVTNAGIFAVQANIPGGALAVTSTSTIVTNAGTFSVQASIPGGALAMTSTSTVITAALPTGTNNIGTVSGSSVTAFQGGAPWNINQSTVYVQNAPSGTLQTADATVNTDLGIINANITNGNQITKISGSVTVTPGTGTFQTQVTTGSITVFQSTNAWNENLMQISGSTPSSTNPLPVRLSDGSGYIASVVNGGIRYTANAMIQNVVASSSNNSTVNLSSGASFTGASESTLGIAAIQVNIKSDQNATIQVQQSPDGINWDIIDSYTVSASTGDGRTIQATASFFRVIVTNTGTAVSTFFRLQVALCPTVEAVPRSLGPKASGASLSVTQARDSRQVIISSAAAVTGTTSETIFTLTVSTNFTNSISGTSFGVTPGKILRFQNFSCAWATTTAGPVGGKCHLRMASAGTCTATSPMVQVIGNTIPGNALSSNSVSADHASFPDGLEISGTQTFCISHIESTATSTIDVTLQGYQY